MATRASTRRRSGGRSRAGRAEPKRTAGRGRGLRATWKGALKLRLVSVPVRVFPATDPRADVSFRQLHAACHTPIELRKWCPHCQREITREEVVKGYEFERGRFVVFSDEEIDAARPESTRVIDLAQVMDRADVDPILIERSYYLAPDDETAGEPFAVIREALDGRAAIGRLALHGREYLVAVVSREDGLLLHTLRRPREVRAMNAIDELSWAHRSASPDEVALARQLLDTLASDRRLDDYADEYEETLRSLIARKVAGEEVVGRAETPPAPTNVVNLMDALRRSLDKAPAASRARGRAGGRQRGRRSSPRHARKAS